MTLLCGDILCQHVSLTPSLKSPCHLPTVQPATPNLPSFRSPPLQKLEMSGRGASRRAPQKVSLINNDRPNAMVGSS